MQTVYVDLLFFVNFCMDFQCLFLTARLLHRPFPIPLAMLSSAIGALYACAALFAFATGPLAFLLDLGVCLLMCALVFCGRGQPLRRLPIPFALYFGVCSAVGGVMSGMAALLSRLSLPIGASEERISSVAFFLLAALGGLCTFGWGKLCQRRGAGARATLTVTLQGRTLCVNGLVDSGNLLSDPVSGRPVVVLRSGALGDWLPPTLKGLTPAGVAQLSGELARRVKLIPTRTVTGAGLLLAILPDAALLDRGRGPVAVEILVAVAPLEEIPADCQALLPAALLCE